MEQQEAPKREAIAVDIKKEDGTATRYIIKRPTLKEIENAGAMAGMEAGENVIKAASSLQRELIKVLVHSVDGVIISGVKRETLPYDIPLLHYNKIKEIVAEMAGLGKKEAEAEVSAVLI